MDMAFCHSLLRHRSPSGSVLSNGLLAGLSRDCALAILLRDITCASVESSLCYDYVLKCTICLDSTKAQIDQVFEIDTAPAKSRIIGTLQKNVQNLLHKIF